MNQILETKLNNKKSNSKKSKTLKFQLIFSIVFIFIIGIYIFFNNFYLSKKEQLSNKILDNYNITKLYSNLSSEEISNFDDYSYILGIIEIPKINIYYPIFSNYSDELLKISPCRFYGPNIGKSRKFMYCWT